MIAPFIAQVSSLSCLRSLQVRIQVFLLSAFDVTVCISGVNVSVSDSGSYSICCGLRGLRSRKLSATYRNERTSSAGEFKLYLSLFI